MLISGLFLVHSHLVSGKSVCNLALQHHLEVLYFLIVQLSDRRTGSSTSGYRKDEYNWRYDNDELPEDVVRASAALENLQLDRKARNLTTSWRFVSEL